MPKTIIGVVIVFAGIIISGLAQGTNFVSLGVGLIAAGFALAAYGWPDFKRFADSMQSADDVKSHFSPRARGDGSPPENST
jgi:hypothetical protein